MDDKCLHERVFAHCLAHPGLGLESKVRPKSRLLGPESFSRPRLGLETWYFLID